MATELAVGYVSIVPEVSDVARLLARALQGVEGQFGDVGADAGQRFVRGVDGRLRDTLTGKFAAEGRQAGEGFADGAEDGADSGGGGGLSGKIGGLVGGLGTAVLGAATIAGAAVGAGFVVGFTNAIETDAQNDKFAAQLGGSPEFQAEMGGIAGRLYANAYGDSLEEAQGAVRGVLQNGLLPEDAATADIEGISAKVLDLVGTFDVDLAGATEAAGALMRNGLAPDAAAAFDIITRGFQEGADRSGDLLDTYSEYSGLFADLGLDATDMTGLLDQGLAGGARNADLVADAFKEFGIRGKDASELSASGFEALGLNAEEMTAKIAGGGEGAAGALDQVLDGLRNMEDPVARNATAVALFGTQAEDLGDSLFALDPSEAAKGLGEVTGAAEKMGTTLADNASTKIETFKRKALGGLTEFIGGTVLPGFEGFLDKAAPIFDDLTAAWKTDGLSGVAEKLGGMWDTAWPIIQAKGAELFERLRLWVIEKGPGIAQGIGEGIYAAANWLIGNWPVFAGKMLEFYGRIGTWIAEEGFPLLGEKMKVLGPALWQWIQDNWPAFVQKMAAFWAAVGVWFATVAVPWMRQKGMELGAAMIEWLATEAAPALLRAVESAKAALAAWFTGTAVPWMLAKGQEMFGKLIDAAQAKGAELVGWVRGLPGMILGALGSVGTTLYEAGRDLIEGLIRGIQAMAGRIADSILGPIGDAVDSVKGALGINSPSKVFMEIGSNTAEGFALGVAKNRGLWDVSDILGPSTAGTRFTGVGRSMAAATAAAPSRPIEVALYLAPDERKVLSRAIYPDLAKQSASARRGQVA